MPRSVKTHRNKNLMLIVRFLEDIFLELLCNWLIINNMCVFSKEGRNEVTLSLEGVHQQTNQLRVSVNTKAHEIVPS